jgi:two-component system LytT family response regulator
MSIRTLIVDDEPLARDRIRGLLDSEPDVEIAAECSTGLDAVAAIRGLQPDLVFLDVQMPELSGFDVLEAVLPAPLPIVIFVTAHDQYALKAFEVHALDYLLKPFDRGRFSSALARVRTQMMLQEESGELNKKLLAILESVKSERKYLDRLVVKSSGRVFFLKAEEIDWIEAAGNYVRLHTGKESHLLRETMASLESRLAPERFVRIHRSTIVNIERIRELRSLFHGDYEVILSDNTELVLSRAYREKLNSHLKTSF